MKKVFLFLMLLLLASCKAPQVVPLILRDSVSVTYRPGTVLSLTDSADSTDPAPSFGAAIKKEQIPQKVKVRVDTIVVERWHTQQVPAPDKPIPRFYKDCTTGFWILLLLLFGSIGLRILRAVAFRK